MISLWKEFQRWRTYRATYKELRALSDEELKDIGFYRGEVRRIAYYAAYQSRGSRGY